MLQLPGGSVDEILNLELILCVHVAYFGGKTEETKQRSGGSDIDRVGFAFLHVLLDATWVSMTDD